ncbi:MAG: FecR domain-containing protein [Fulvivirga sp.]|uniref:FecR family protein n=1 Tax=Fulvivirga sp. TaxID=1931237 RepID=UPI0032F05AEF
MLPIEELIIKYIENECTVVEKHQVEDWINQSDENRQKFDELRTIWLSAKVNSTDEETAWNTIEKQIISTTRPAFSFYKIAASILLIATIGLSYIYFNTDSQNYFPTISSTVIRSESDKKEVVLPDGSQVTLNKNSSIKYNGDFQSSRKIKLTGEAFFDVVRDESHPFIITTETINVKVLGTSFDIKAKPGKKASVHVKSGVVQVNNIIDRDSIQVVKNEQVVVSDNHLVKANMTNENAFAWKTGIITFNNDQFSEVVSTLEEVYDIEIELANPRLSQCVLTAKFENKSIKEVMTLLKEIYRFNVSYKNAKIIVNGNSC